MEGRFARALFLARLFLLLCHIGVLRAGYIGCKFSEIVCLEDEVCIDDQLFGNCQKWEGPKDYYQFDLDDRSLKILEGELLQLIENGYTWDNPYTQCILGGLLGGFREGMSFDRRYCGDDFPKDTEGDLLTPEVLETLYRYLGKGDLSPAPSIDDSPDAEEAFADIPSQPEPTVDKKDEIVKVHKYFVNKDDKRGFGEGVIEGFGDEYSDLPTDGADSQRNEVLNDLSPQDLAALEDYLSLSQKPQEPVYSERAPDDLDLESYAPQETPQVQDEPVLDPDDDPIWGDVDDDEESPASVPDTEAEEPPSSLADPELPGAEANEMLQALSPDDAKLLSDLISGKVDVDGLTSEQVDRLNQYVNLLLGFLEPPEDQEQEVDGSTSIGKLKEAADGKVKKIPPVVKKEQADYASVSSPQGQSRVSVHFKDKKTSLQEAGAAVAQAKRKVSPALQDKYAYIDANFVDIEVVPSFSDTTDGKNFLQVLAQLANIPDDRFTDVELNPDKDKVNFKVYSDGKVNASRVATIAEEKSERLKNKTGHSVVKASLGRGDTIGVQEHSLNTPKYYVLTLVLCGVIASAVIAGILIYVLRRHSNALNKLSQLSQNGDTAEASQDYQDLCRQRMQSKASEKPEPIHPASRVSSVSTQEAAVRSPSSRSSTSSWSEEPASSSMDITTGHIVLSYMEDHLKNKDRLDQEWEALCAYEAEPNSTVVACDASNMRRNRYSDILPYDHSRVVLSKSCNVSGSDYINGSSITDHDPRNPAYIATQGPLPHTVADFWQMVWEQGGVVIVNLTKLTENGVAMCHRYWPEEGSDLYHIYEVHLVSEHIWCEDYLVRSFYLKNLQTNETRTVTQFHFLTWTDLGVPSSVKALLDFRRKVNKSYRGRSCPIVVQCSDGAGRTGTYCLIDMVLNRMGKGAKEIDIAATLEHIRDQRMGMVKTKEQFEFALAAVAEEVHAILKALPQ